MVPPPLQGELSALAIHPRVLVVAPDDDRLGPLCRGLDALGWTTVTARSEHAALAALADLPLDVAVIDGRCPTGLAPALQIAARPRRLPVLAVDDTGTLRHDPAVDLAMSAPPHPAQAALRLEHLIRAAIAEEEMTLREATFAARGTSLVQTDAEQTPLRVLAAGRPDQRFLALHNALIADGCEVVAAPTPYTAFDYLHERAFDAAVLWGGEDHAPAQSIASGMKRNTRLYHIPLVLYLSGRAEIDLEQLYGRGFADVAAADTPEDETARRIVALARTYRRHQVIRRTLESARSSGLTDAATGLFTPSLFAAHLARIAEAAADRRRPLSVCVLRVADAGGLAQMKAEGWLGRALPQIGAMVSRLIRTEDTAARLSPDVFALALPATTAAEARIAAERIAAVIGCTAFDAGAGRSPFVVGFDIGAAEMGPGESPGTLLERASAAVVPAAA